MTEENKQSTAANFKEVVYASIGQMEDFLNTQGFRNEAKALFYLGTLLHRVGVAQYQKKYKNKPILKKVNFQGMSSKEILRLYEDVVEKLRQHNKLTLFSEHLMHKFHTYFGNLERKWPLNEHANVFYLMAGYAYMVGSKAPDMTKEEKQSVEQDPNSIEE